jgi:uncharacterized membrane protein
MIKQEKPDPKANPNGPIIVPKINGLGWTLNFARWESFVILGLIILGAVGIVFLKDWHI